MRESELIYPRLDLEVRVVDENGEKLSGAWVNIFVNKGAYNDYLRFNPEGKPGKIQDRLLPGIYAAETNQEGVVLIQEIELTSGVSVLLGKDYQFSPNPIYLRAEAMRVHNSDTIYLTNDADSLLFGQLSGSGTRLSEQITLTVRP